MKYLILSLLIGGAAHAAPQSSAWIQCSGDVTVEFTPIHTNEYSLKNVNLFRYYVVDQNHDLFDAMDLADDTDALCRVIKKDKRIWNYINKGEN